MPLLSVILPVFITNQHGHDMIMSAISSIVQESSVYEIIVVDDCSPLKIVMDSNFASISKIKVIRHDQNMGAGAARNTGMLNAKTELISFLDYDDYLFPGTLEKRLEYACGRGGYPDIRQDIESIQGCGWEEIRKHGLEKRTRFAANSRSNDDYFRGCWFCPGSTIIANRKFLLENVGGFDVGLRRLEDVDLFIRAGLNGARYYSVPVMGTKIFHHRQKSVEDILSACNLIEKKYLLKSNDFEKILSKRQRKLLRAYLHLETANAALIDKNFGALTLNLLQYFLKNPDKSTRWFKEHQIEHTSINIG